MTRKMYESPPANGELWQATIKKLFPGDALYALNGLSLRVRIISNKYYPMIGINIYEKDNRGHIFLNYEKIYVHIHNFDTLISQPSNLTTGEEQMATKTNEIVNNKFWMIYITESGLHSLFKTEEEAKACILDRLKIYPNSVCILLESVSKFEVSAPPVTETKY